MGGKALTHDLNGNLTGDGEWTLGYDPEGRLVRTTVNGVETNLLYDGQKLVAEYDGAGQLVRRYAFGPGVDEPLVQYEGGGTCREIYALHMGYLRLSLKKWWRLHSKHSVIIRSMVSEWC